MTGYKPSPIEKNHNGLNIQKQLLKGEHRMLPNITVMKVFKKAVETTVKDEFGDDQVAYGEAFPPGDFKWWHNPHWGDDEYAILIPMVDAPTYERMRKKPREKKSYTYEFEMEEIRVDFLMLTYCEIARFLENTGGEAAVMAFVGHPVVAFDEIMQEEVMLRSGFLDTVRVAEYTESVAEDVKIAFLPVGAGPYKDTCWKDVPQQYVESVAAGRMGAAYENQKIMAQQELERRTREKMKTLPKAEPVSKSLNTAMPSPEPKPESKPQSHSCEAMASTTGERCKAKATIEIDGKWYCQRHAAALNPATVGGEQ